MCAVVILGASALTLYYTHKAPSPIGTSGNVYYDNYINNTFPQAYGTFNTTILGSSADFGYEVLISNNSSLLTYGYEPVIQVEILEISQNLSTFSHGFSVKIGSLSFDFGNQTFTVLGKKYNASGTSNTALSGSGMAKSKKIEFFDYTLTRPPIQVGSTFNFSIVFIPQLLIGNIAVGASPVHETGTISAFQDVNSNQAGVIQHG